MSETATKTTKTTKSATKRPERVEKKAEITRKAQYVYIGPSIMKGKYGPGKVFKDIPKEIEDLAKTLPAIKHMFVLAKDYPKKKGELNKANSTLNTMYNKVVKWKNQGGK